MKSQINLIEFDASNNKLTAIDANLFRGLSKLKKINLNDNKLTDIDTNLFNDSLNLELLNLSFNKISKINLTGLVNLKDLDLHDNYFASVPNLQDLFNLEQVYLSCNRISKIEPNQFENLKKLKNCSIWSNLLLLPDKKSFEKIPIVWDFC